MTTGSIPLFIDGKEVVTEAVFDVKAPASGEKLWTSSTASVEQALLAVEAASRAFSTWRKTKPGVIQKIFLKAADLYEERREHILSLCMTETGMLRPLAELFHNDTVAMIRDLSGRAANIHGAIPPLAEPGRAGLVLREPYGVIFSIAPWNAPLPLGTRAFAFALAAGNTAVFKGSELCPATFHELIRIFHEAGVPPGVLNSITVQPADAAAVTQAVIEHAAVRKITFTGSTSVGRIIATMAGRVLKPTVMELGGKAAAIVCADADIADAAFQCALGSFLHAGQICMSTERIIVHSSIREAFTAELKAAVAKVYPPEAALPVLATVGGADKTRALIDDAVAKGAEVVVGPTSDGKAVANMTPHNLHPTILAGVKPSMALHETESFGPSVALYYVDSDDAAVELANATVYGLAAAVFTQDLGRGLRLAKRLESGAVHINRMSVHDEPALPHGGVQDSGWGRFNGQWGVDEFLRWKTITYVE